MITADTARSNVKNAQREYINGLIKRVMDSINEESKRGEESVELEINYRHAKTYSEHQDEIRKTFEASGFSYSDKKQIGLLTTKDKVDEPIIYYTITISWEEE